MYCIVLFLSLTCLGALLVLLISRQNNSPPRHLARSSVVVVDRRPNHINAYAKKCHLILTRRHPNNMLLDLVSKARSGGTSAEIEAMMAERDFFRERYAEQIETIDRLNVKLKESQRVIDKLRSQILDLEMEKQSRGGDMAIANRRKEISCGNNDDNPMSKSDDDDTGVHEPSNEVVTSLDAGLDTLHISAPQAANETSIDRAVNNVASPLDDEQSTAIDRESIDEGEEEADEDEPSSDNDENEAEEIRANAERMLQWANYQTSKRSTPNTSMSNMDDIDDDDDDDGNKIGKETNSEAASSAPLRSSTPSKSVSENETYNLLDDDYDDDDDDESSQGSSSTHSSAKLVGNMRSGATSKGGKIGKLFNNLRDMIEGPPSESDSGAESDDLSTD